MSKDLDPARSVDQCRLFQGHWNIQIELADEEHMTRRSNPRQYEHRQRIEHAHLIHHDKRGQQDRHAGNEHGDDDVDPQKRLEPKFEPGEDVCRRSVDGQAQRCK